MASTNKTTSEDKSAFAKLSQEEQQRRDDADAHSKRPRSMTIISRMVLFFVAPLFVGSVGLISSHMQSKYAADPEPMNFDRDFIYPFLITLVLVVVVSIQTGNFSSYKAEPIVAWPKVIKKRTVIRKMIVVDDDGNVIEDEDLLKDLKPFKDVKDKKDD